VLKKKKVTRAKRIGGVAQAIECLLSKYSSQSSNPNTPRKKEKKIPE
jgi:hypothetical protein